METRSRHPETFMFPLTAAQADACPASNTRGPNSVVSEARSSVLLNREPAVATSFLPFALYTSFLL